MSRLKIGNLSESDIARFWSKVEIKANPDSCWLWTGSDNGKGYGKIVIGGVHFMSPRVSYFLYYKEEPACRDVLHKCDNPPCVNPAHLFLGSNYENVQDSVAKRRRAYGESNPSHKLTTSDVLRIHAEHSKGRSQRAIARDFGVSSVTVNHIVNGRIWASIYEQYHCAGKATIALAP